MATYTSSISTRTNGQKILRGWFNEIKTVLASLESFFGTGYLGETSFTVANNNASPASVTGLVVNKDNYKSAHVFVEIRRKTDTTEVISNGRLILQYRDLDTDWELLDELSGDDDGVTFTITSAGQVQYVSDNMSGSDYVGTMKFKGLVFSA